MITRIFGGVLLVSSLVVNVMLFPVVGVSTGSAESCEQAYRQVINTVKTIARQLFGLLIFIIFSAFPNSYLMF